MDEFQDQLTRAGEALTSLVEGPGLQAADALETAFARAGTSIEAALSRAARSGEADFSRMAQSVLGELARIAAEAALAQAGFGSTGQAVTVNMNMGGAHDRAPAGLQQELSKALAKAVAMGGRYL